MKRSRILLAALLGFSPSVYAANWPAWRGPHGDGITTETNLPLRWSKTENVTWRVPLPEPGNSTPIVWNDRVFVTQPVAQGNRRTLMCFERKSGKLLWQKGVTVDHKERTHETNPYASASPVTDGERVVCWFGSGGVVAYDFEGNELWRKDLGPHDHEFGYGGSPVIHRNLVLLNFGPGVREFLVALDKQTGNEVWRHTSPVPGQDNIDGTWSTPVVAKVGETFQVISALRGELAGLDPATGKVLWRAPTAGNVSKVNPIVADGVLLMSWDKDHPEIAYRFESNGTISPGGTLWQRRPPKQRVGSGVIHKGLSFGVQRDGLVECTKLDSGEILWNERLQASSPATRLWTSPLLSGDRLYVMNQSGDTFVFEASATFELLTRNTLGEISNSSVVPSNGQLFLRTHQALWCIGAN